MNMKETKELNCKYILRKISLLLNVLFLPLYWVKVRCRISGLKTIGRNKRFSGRIIGLQYIFEIFGINYEKTCILILVGWACKWTTVN